MLHLRRETVSRAMTYLKELGLVAPAGRGRIRVHRPEMRRFVTGSEGSHKRRLCDLEHLTVFRFGGRLTGCLAVRIIEVPRSASNDTLVWRHWLRRVGRGNSGERMQSRNRGSSVDRPGLGLALTPWDLTLTGAITLRAVNSGDCDSQRGRIEGRATAVATIKY